MKELSILNFLLRIPLKCSVQRFRIYWRSVNKSSLRESIWQGISCFCRTQSLYLYRRALYYGHPRLPAIFLLHQVSDIPLFLLNIGYKLYFRIFFSAEYLSVIETLWEACILSICKWWFSSNPSSYSYCINPKVSCTYVHKV